MIAVPNLGWVRTEVTARLIQWAGQKHLIVFPGLYKPVDFARNKIVKIFMESDCTHLLMVDADTIPPEDAVQKLLDADKMIISGVTNSMIRDPRKDKFVALPMTLKRGTKRGEELMYFSYTGKGVEEVDRVGGSCLMIHRDVVQSMILKGPMFLSQFDAQGFMTVSEDMAFCDAAKEEGWKIYAHYDVNCLHIKENGI